MEDNIVNEILDLYKSENWLEIINKYHNHPDRNKVLWVFPSENNLEFLKRTLSDFNCTNILSIGCGSGLLEWIITQATGIAVEGLEIDGAWWNCKYSPPTFIPLHLTQSNLENDTIDKIQKAHCLLFSYFNNREAFNNYMKHFTGNVLIIIGPGEGKFVHTDPKPFDNIGMEWKLSRCEEVRNSEDFIAIYLRNM